ncbi:hypothetical protein LTR10_020557 [Elasticomyces elasticus]|uniref:DUF7587 domain-containing protein n=1 Tax=Exophiala sideris TaxID=1016849 RepID=A0ABR0JK09_9EURO|nr:hypothetical protein LTR10_020557 [Elasticomyces elasticus]KAK5035411.1 hypothetical protein LTS07_002848 [Exophiala sideris]KAK5039238.1 hypothetical protein LTR13_003494 [Exophiala sideris]KAK5066335.1 hypothetical protein LTR69_002854 [Exophiala sideris]KAK5187012.1 hypothetical protein LTR44_001019 [Eurotiomycetes sp. CCFEE 6388]
MIEPEHPKERPTSDTTITTTTTRTFLTATTTTTVHVANVPANSVSLELEAPSLSPQYTLYPDQHEIEANFNSVSTKPPLTLSGLRAFLDEKKTNVQLPPILYRAYDSGSMGMNSKDEGFQSQRMLKTGKRMMLETIAPDAFRDLIIKHVQHFKGPKGKKSFKSPWISFSCSLLTTLQRAKWQHERGYENVTIAAVDISGLSTNEFIFTVPELASKIDYDEERDFIQFDCNEEYLVINQLQGRVCHVPFHILQNDGLRTLLPELEMPDVYKSLGWGLKRLRGAAFGREYPLSGDEIDACIRLTKNFFTGQRCCLIYFALLALRRRPVNDPAIDGHARAKMKRWRLSAAYDNRGRVKLDNLYYFAWKYVFSHIEQSEHLEIRQFARIGARLIGHAKEDEKRIDAEIMGKIWGEFDEYLLVSQQPAGKLLEDGSSGHRYTRCREILHKYRHTSLRMLCADVKAKALVIDRLGEVRRCPKVLAQKERNVVKVEEDVQRVGASV